MKKLKELAENKVFKICFTIVKVIFVIFILAFVAVVYLQRISDNKVSLGGYRMFTVISKSMEPKYTIGDVLFSKEVPYSSIKIHDDISYLGKSGDVRDKIVTHRVEGIEKDESGKYLFRAKGIANLIEDPIVSEEQVYGIVVHKSGLLTMFSRITSSNIGMFICIIIPILSVLTYEAVVTLLEQEEKKRSKA